MWSRDRPEPGTGARFLVRRGAAEELRVVSPPPSLPVRRGLDAVELGVRAALGHEVLVAAGFDDPGSVEDDDEVGHGHGAEAMGDEEGDAAALGGTRALLPAASARGARIALEERVLGLCVEGRRRLVEDQEERALAQEAARQRQLLPLSETD